MDRPLAVVIQSSSAAGKSSLMDAVLDLMPEEERTQYSAMTGQSLFYLGETDLRHRILAIAEEEGAERASYALKLLQSEGELTIASTGKDPATGRLVTQAYRVEGPVMIFLTTTAMEVDEELLNRCLVLSVDEGREQTRAIHARQRSAETLSGILAKRARERVVKLHRDAQRLLRPLLVVNPFAEELGFLDHATRTRRDHMKYLTLIRTIALLHQYQREVKTVREGGDVLSYIEVTRADIAEANRLCHEVLGRSLDELPPQTRRLLGLVEGLVRDACGRQGVQRQDYRFSRREGARGDGGGGRRSCGCISGAFSRWSTCSSIGASRGRATCTSWRTTARARTARPLWPVSATLQLRRKLGGVREMLRGGRRATWRGLRGAMSGGYRVLRGPTLHRRTPCKPETRRRCERARCVCTRWRDEGEGAAS